MNQKTRRNRQRRNTILRRRNNKRRQRKTRVKGGTSLTPYHLLTSIGDTNDIKDEVEKWRVIKAELELIKKYEDILTSPNINNILKSIISTDLQEINKIDLDDIIHFETRFEGEKLHYNNERRFKRIRDKLILLYNYIKFCHENKTILEILRRSEQLDIDYAFTKQNDPFKGVTRFPVAPPPPPQRLSPPPQRLPPPPPPPTGLTTNLKSYENAFEGLANITYDDKILHPGISQKN